jgi:hypothetical protein
MGLLNAGKQNQFQKDQAADVAKQADASALRQYSQLQIRQEQEAARATQAIQENVVHATNATSTAKTSLAESGVAGNTASELIGEYARTSSNYESAVIRNKAFLDQNFRDQAKSVQLGEQANVNRAYASIQPPNYLGILLQGAAGFLALKGKSDALAPPGGAAGALAPAAMGDYQGPQLPAFPTAPAGIGPVVAAPDPFVDYTQNTPRTT